MNTIRKILTLTSLLVFGGTAVVAAEPTKVAIGYPPATDFLASYVAKEQGIFAKHNQNQRENNQCQSECPDETNQAAHRSGNRLKPVLH